MDRAYSHIDLDERRRIARWRTVKLSVDVIAEKLGRHRSTIFRELKHNQFHDDEIKDLNGYYSTIADQKCRERRSKQRKLIRYDELQQSVIDHISDGWSPQQIARRMRLEQHSISASHDTIYQFVHSAEGRKEGLWKYLFAEHQHTHKTLASPPNLDQSASVIETSHSEHSNEPTGQHRFGAGHQTQLTALAHSLTAFPPANILDSRNPYVFCTSFLSNLPIKEIHQRH